MRAIVLAYLLLLGSAAADELRIAIVAPQTQQTNGKRWVAMGKDAHMSVVLTNDSDAPVRLWEERYSWGYYALSFEVTDATSGTKPVLIAKRPRGWKKNLPAYIDVMPHEPFVIDVQLDPDIWNVPPALLVPNNGIATVRIRAVYKVVPDDESRRLHAWTGEIHSPTYEIMRSP